MAASDMAVAARPLDDDVKFIEVTSQKRKRV